MNKHSPTPWALVRDYGLRTQTRIVALGGETVATLARPLAGETEANALLVLAAPALRDALEATVCIGCETAIGQPPKDMTAPLGMAACPVCKEARAALQKAGGQ